MQVGILYRHILYEINFFAFGGLDLISLKPLTCFVLSALLVGCALFPAWHWEKKGAGQEAYAFDETECKARSYAGADGMVTNASVRRMHACMAARGWVKVAN